MIRKIICINRHKCFNSIKGIYDIVTGLTIDGIVEYYTGQRDSNAYIANIPILLNQSIDDIGFLNPDTTEWTENSYYYAGDYALYNENSYRCITSHASGTGFTYSNWEIIPLNNLGDGVSVITTGDSRIDEFRRYGKSDTDSDLYNPLWNTGFTQEISTSNGVNKKITGETNNIDGLSYQKLYGYNIWNNSNNIISYTDIGNNLSRISYVTSGLTVNNSINMPSIKLDYLIGLVDSPKINVDVYIDRGTNSSFDRHIRLGDVKSLTDLEHYGNGHYKIKED
jgi:hypothetical protein